MSFDDGDTFALVFERDDSVGEFSGFAPEDDFVMVEDTLSEEHSSDGSDVNLWGVLDVGMKDKFGCAKIELEKGGELLGLEESLGKILDKHDDYVIWLGW